MLSQVKALRAGHPLGWREDALDSLARLAVMPTPRRDLVELRTEAVATLATLDIRLVTRISLPHDDIRSIAFSPDGRTLITAGFTRGLDFWDVRGRRHLAAVRGLNVTDVYETTLVAFLPGGSGSGRRDPRSRRRVHRHATASARPAPRSPGDRASRRSWPSTPMGIGSPWPGPSPPESPSTTRPAAPSSAGSRTPPFALSPDGRWLARHGAGSRRVAAAGLGRTRGRARPRTDGSAPSPSAPTRRCSPPRPWTTPRRSGTWRSVSTFGTLQGHRAVVNDVAFSPDGGAIATVSGDYTARIWDTQTGRELATLPGSAVDGPGRRGLPTANISPRPPTRNRRSSCIGSRAGTTSSGGSAATASSSGAWRRTLAWSSSRHSAAELITWDVSAPRPTPRRLGTEPGMGSALAYSPNGSLLATGGWTWSGSQARRIVVRDADTGEVRTRVLHA